MTDQAAGGTPERRSAYLPPRAGRAGDKPPPPAPPPAPPAAPPPPSAPPPTPPRWGDPVWHEEKAHDLFLTGWNQDSNTEIKAMWAVFNMAAAQVHASLAASARLAELNTRLASQVDG